MLLTLLQSQVSASDAGARRSGGSDEARRKRQIKWTQRKTYIEWSKRYWIER